MHAVEGLQIYYNTSKDGDIYHTIVGILLRNIHKINSCTIYDIAGMCYCLTTNHQPA
jgi:hypothetical protein